MPIQHGIDDRMRCDDLHLIGAHDTTSVVLSALWYSIDIDDHIHLAMIAAVISGEMRATLSGQVGPPTTTAPPVADFGHLRAFEDGSEGPNGQLYVFALMFYAPRSSH